MFQIFTSNDKLFCLDLEASFDQFTKILKSKIKVYKPPYLKRIGPASSTLSRLTLGQISYNTCSAVVVQSLYLSSKSTSYSKTDVTRTPSPAAQSPWLPALTLLGIPAVVILLWLSKHTLFSGVAFGWAAVAELVLPLGACTFATIVFLVPNPMHALLSLLGVFFTSVLFYLAAGIAFVGLVFLIVYVGAVAVLFLFVIMLLNVKSLTSKDVLIQHLTQWLAIITTTFLFHHLYSRVFTAVSHALIGWNVRVSSLELTSEEAVLFYVRYEAADINRLVGLYTVHSPVFLVTTVFLLVSLLGAIILATVTTERATALADIRNYKTTAISCAALFIVFSIFIDTIVDLLQSILDFNLALAASLYYEIFFMSMFTPFSHRNRGVVETSSLADGAPVSEEVPKLRVVLPRVLATSKRGGALLCPRYQFSWKAQELRPFLVAHPSVVTKVSKKASFFHKMYSKLLQHFLDGWFDRPSLVKNFRKGFTPMQTKYRREVSPSRRQLVAYSAVTAAVKPVTTKWNAPALLSWDLYPQNRMLRLAWLWRWRPERATSLLRSRRIPQSIDEQPEGWEYKQEIYDWDWRVYAAKCPLNLFTLGPVGYLRYLCSTRLLPFLYYYAWRGRAFFSIWLFMVVALPLILVPFPWFLSDYHELWPVLEKLHDQVYNFVNRYTMFASYSRLIKELVVTALLYPAAAINIILTYPWTVVSLAVLYACEVVLFTGGDFARAELHDSKCNHFRIQADRRHWKWDAPWRRAALARYRQHPDKGRRDLSLLVAVSASGAQASNSITQVAAPVCPVNPNKVSEFLAAALDYIRYTPSWIQSISRDLAFMDPYSTREHFTVVFFFVVVAVVFYSLCSLFIVLNWSRVYPGRSRPSLVPSAILLFVALYVWVCLYPCLPPLYTIFPVRTAYESRPLHYAFAFVWLVSLALLPYMMLRYEYFKFYKHFAYGNIQRLHSFVNYYMYTWGFIDDMENRSGVDNLVAASADEVKTGLTARRAARKKWEGALIAFYLSYTKYLYQTWDKSYHDPEPNPFCRPRRAGSHRYTHSPFKRHRLTFVKRRQARVPMPPKTTFEGMFSPVIIMFTSLHSQHIETMMYAEYSSITTPLLSSLLLPLTFSIPTPWMMKKFLASPSTYCELPSVLSRFEPPHVLISFLPEIMLAFIITYLIGAVAVELAANRAPKVLAIECWRAACWGLAFVAFLYCVQLLGYIQNAPVASGYLYVSKGLTASKLFVTLSSLFVLHLSENYIREHTRHVLEFSVILLLGVLLLLILVSANNLMLVFFSLAGFSLNLYILILYDGADAASREASLKYFYLSTLSAGFILFGILLIYVMVGDVTYYAIRAYMNTPIDGSTATTMSVAILFILIGFFFKLSAFPGHLWAVEVYEGSPLPVMAFFILPVKVAIFITFMRLLNTGLLEFSHIWLPAVTIAAIGSLLWGAFAATQERKTTRFLGYASINQIGFLLLGLIADTDDALRSAFFYLILYAIMTGGFLLVFTQLRKENGATFVALSDFRGLGKTENLVCWNLAVFLFSMAGIPPLAGFFGKYYLLSSLMEKGLFAPVILGLAISLITAYYYLRIIKTFWFEEDAAIKPTVLLLSTEQRTLLSVLEATLWVAAVFAPWLLPILTDTIATLAVCADSSASSNQAYIFILHVGKLLIADTCDPAVLS